MEGLQEVINALSNGTICDPPTTSSSPRLRFTTPTKTLIAIISGTAKATHFKFSMRIQKISGHSYIRHIARSSLRQSELIGLAVADRPHLRVRWLGGTFNDTAFIPLKSVKLFHLRVQLFPDLLYMLEIYIQLHRLQKENELTIPEYQCLHSSTKPHLLPVRIMNLIGLQRLIN